MKATSALIAVLTVACIGVWSSASRADDYVADKYSNYVAFKAGVYSPSDTYDLNNTHLNNKTGFSGEIAAGHYLMPMLALEFGGGYFERKASDIKVKVIPVIATAKVILPLGVVEPYGLFGFGAYVTELNVHDTQTEIRNDTKVTYGFHGGAGLNVNLTDIVFVGAEGKYIWAKPKFGGDDIKLNGFITTANLGFRF